MVCFETPAGAWARWVMGPVVAGVVAVLTAGCSDHSSSGGWQADAGQGAIAPSRAMALPGHLGVAAPSDRMLDRRNDRLRSIDQIPDIGEIRVAVIHRDSRLRVIDGRPRNSSSHRTHSVEKRIQW